MYVTNAQSATAPLSLTVGGLLMFARSTSYSSSAEPCRKAANFGLALVSRFTTSPSSIQVLSPTDLDVPRGDLSAAMGGFVLREETSAGAISESW